LAGLPPTLPLCRLAQHLRAERDDLHAASSLTAGASLLRLAGLLPEGKQVLDNLVTRRFDQGAQLDLQSSVPVTQERTIGSVLDRNVDVAGTETVCQSFLLHRFAQQAVEECRGGLPLLGTAPGYVEDVIGVVAPEVVLGIEDVQFPPAPLRRREVVDGQVLVHHQRLIRGWPATDQLLHELARAPRQGL